MVKIERVANENEVRVRGILLNMSSVYRGGELPRRVSVSGSGVPEGVAREGVRLGFNASYDVGARLFTSWTGSNIPAGFQDEVVEAVEGFYREVLELEGVGEGKADTATGDVAEGAVDVEGGAA